MLTYQAGASEASLPPFLPVFTVCIAMDIDKEGTMLLSHALRSAKQQQKQTNLMQIK